MSMLRAAVREQAEACCMACKLCLAILQLVGVSMWSLAPCICSQQSRCSYISAHQPQGNCPCLQRSQGSAEDVQHEVKRPSAKDVCRTLQAELPKDSFEQVKPSPRI